MRFVTSCVFPLYTNWLNIGTIEQGKTGKIIQIESYYGRKTTDQRLHFIVQILVCFE